MEKTPDGPMDSGIVSQILLEFIEKNNLVLKEQIKVIRKISPTLGRDLQEMLKKSEKKILRLKKMFRTVLTNEPRRFNSVSGKLLDKIERDRQDVMLLTDHMTDIVLAVYISIKDTVTFMKRRDM